MQQPVRVLLIDGSVSFRHSLTEGLRSYLPSGSRIESVGDSYAAQAMCVRFQPHLLAMTYDLAIRMVNTDSNLKILSQATKLPILVYSVPLDKRLALISDGARDCVSASSTGERSQSYYKAFALKIMMLDEVKAMQRASRPVAGSVSNVNQNPRAGFVSSRAPAGFDAPRRKSAAAETLEKQLANMSFAPRKGKEHLPQPLANAKIQLIAIGSSTGGTEALGKLLKDLKPPLPGIVIVQHIPPMFSKLFAARLDSECSIIVKEAEDGDVVKPNTAYIAQGGKHMTLTKENGKMILHCQPGAKVHGCCPAVDLLFESVAQYVGDAALGVILTGIGHDGTDGLIKMKRRGSPTIGQDEKTSIVYGMPKSAFEAGVIDKQLPLNAIAAEITKIARG
ncbi:MAG: hypothetical protein IJ575_08060 [Selenomonadaceae bacterium]|nr:hypothetical protein [Selenomonadaceae bacterium]